MPYWRSQLRTRLSPLEVKARLAALTIAPEDAYLGLPLRGGRPMRIAATADDGYAFVGTVSDREFSLSRNWPHDKALRPELHGRLETTAGGTRIRLRQRLPWAPIAIAAVVAAFVFFGPLAVDRPAWPPSPEALIALAVVTLMTAGGFAKSAIDNRRYLMDLLAATPAPAQPPRPPTVGR
jgi:hypothetical protein